MDKPLREQVKAAKRAYILQLSRSRSGMERRYCVYLDAGDGLEILWPTEGYSPKTKANYEPLLDGMVYCQNRKYPAFHFRFGGCGYSAADEIRRTLTEINPAIEVAQINGHSPSFSML